jgi:transposase
MAAAEAAQEAAAAKDGASRRRRVRRRNLGALPTHLSRVEVLVDVEDKSCPCCGGALHVLGESREEMLDLVPAQLRVKVIRRPRYGCRACEGAVRQAPAPARPITGGPRAPTGARRCADGSLARWPARRCWRRCWWPSSVIICRFTAKP